MSSRNGSRDVVWIAAVSLGLLIAFITGLYLRGDRDPVAQMALKEKRLSIVSAMRLSLAAASEAQNSAVMSTREQDSKSFADEARSAATDLDRQRTELDQLLKGHADRHEAELMARVSESVSGFEQVHQQLMDLAVLNSNRKAFELAHGPAMKLLKEMDEALARLAAEDTYFTSDERLRVLQLVSDVRTGILSTQVLLLPHIAEATDQKMDEFEAELTKHDQKVRETFDELKSLLPKQSQSNLEATRALYQDFDQLKSRIITLSRQNTDLKAVTIALKEKRQAMLACQDALVALEHAIRGQAITSTIPAGRSK